MGEPLSWKETIDVIIHQIRIDFNVTENIKRYVYVYVLEGKYLYLIDSGVAGSQTQITEYIKSIGRDVTEVKSVILTHSHPDHIGTAAWFRENIGCTIYAGEKERKWIENIDIQYQERPIPNFYNLAGAPVKVDYFYPAWDITYSNENIDLVIENAFDIVNDIEYAVGIASQESNNIDTIVKKVCQMLNKPLLEKHPLFTKTICAHIQTD